MFYINTLTIAGSDCSGGAGIQADIKTMSALGCYASSVITAVTSQNTTGVNGVYTLPGSVVASQIESVMGDINVNAVKIGMVSDASAINAIFNTLMEYPTIPVITDPVMVSSHGEELMRSDARDLFVAKIIPITFLLTPNIPEAESLAGMKICTADDIYTAARVILNMGCERVLIKGGHATSGGNNEKTDHLFWFGGNGTLRHEQYSSPTVVTNNSHGTGCTLSSAITAYIARGLDVVKAVEKAKEFVYNALREGAEVTTGKGNGPLDHFFSPKRMIKQETL